MSVKVAKIAVLGASGYTGADLVRLAVRHPGMEITALTADSQAGKPYGEVFPHLGRLALPSLVRWDDVSWRDVDAVFCGLPHGTTQEITRHILSENPRATVIDMSADFRLRDPAVYASWYGGEHKAIDLQREAVYGLTELNRHAIPGSRLIACPGCYPTATLLALLPLVSAGMIDADDLVIDAKSGVSGAGRGLKQNTLFCEAGEGISPYAVGRHRHAPEIEQEIARAADRDIRVNFIPHLVPMSRGELVTCHIRTAGSTDVGDLRERLSRVYREEQFVRVLEPGAMPSTSHVRGSNYCDINIFEDRIRGRAVVIAALDNLVKGSAGQAIQNFNVAFRMDETMGLEQLPLFP